MPTPGALTPTQRASSLHSSCGTVHRGLLLDPQLVRSFAVVRDPVVSSGAPRPCRVLAGRACAGDLAP